MKGLGIEGEKNGEKNGLEVRMAVTKSEVKEVKRDEIVVRKIRRPDRIRIVGQDWRGILEECRKRQRKKL